MPHLEDYQTETTFRATVRNTERITDSEHDAEIRHIDLELEASNFSFEVGQSIGVLVPGPHAFGNQRHFRLYSIASTRTGENGNPSTIAICVRRCFYIDSISGERYPGVASNYLCDLKEGDSITFTGPHGLPFEIPEDPATNLLMVGLGTGIAPFRAFVREIYASAGGWQGKVRLFYGAETGLELVYMNDMQNDFTNYYDQETFQAFEAISPRPYLGEPIALEQTLEENREEVWDIIQDPDSRVYVAGLERVAEMLDKALGEMAGSEEKWQRRKAEMIAGQRWSELIY
jgi:ferredoxin--NADP+ reductase